MVIDKRVTLLHVLAIVGAGLILTTPVLIYGFPRIADDAGFHALWSSHFSTQLWSGNLYPRWLIGMNAGLGSPVFFYYPPVSYYLAGMLHPLFPNDPDAWKQLGAAVSLALILSGASAYLWLREIERQSVALAAAILYMILPYHLAVDLYTRGAFAEFCSFIWMPLILFFTIKVINNRPLALVGLALSYAMLIMTHLPVTLGFSIVPVAYGIFKAEAGGRRTAFLKIVAAMALGVGLSAIFLLPAMMTQDYVQLQSMTTGFNYYGNWFLFAGLKLWGDYPSKLSVMVLIVLMLAACALILTRQAHIKKREQLFWVAIVALSLLMMTPLSKPIWQVVTVLQSLQFPYRFNAVLVVGVTALLAFGISALKRPLTLLTGLTSLAMAGLVGVCLLATVLAARSAYPAFNPLPEVMGKLDQQLKSTEEVQEYWPRWTRGVDHQLLLEEARKPNARLEEAVSEATDSVIVQRWKPRDILLESELTKDHALIVNQLYYPGWTAQTVGDASALPVEPSSEGLLRIHAPAGKQQIALRLQPNPPERIGQIISVSSAFITLLLILYAYLKPKWRRQSSQRSEKLVS